MWMSGSVDLTSCTLAIWLMNHLLPRSTAQGTIRHCVKDANEDDIIHIYCPPNQAVSVQSVILGHNKWRTCLNVNSTCRETPHPADVITCVSRDRCGYIMRKYSLKCGGYLDFVRISYTCKRVKDPDESGRIGPGVIAGAICGTLCASALCIAAACVYRRKKLKVNDKKDVEASTNENHVSVTESSLTVYSPRSEGGCASSETSSSTKIPPEKSTRLSGHGVHDANTRRDVSIENQTLSENDRRLSRKEQWCLELDPAVVISNGDEADYNHEPRKNTESRESSAECHQNIYNTIIAESALDANSPYIRAHHGPLTTDC